MGVRDQRPGGIRHRAQNIGGGELAHRSHRGDQCQHPQQECSTRDRLQLFCELASRSVSCVVVSSDHGRLSFPFGCPLRFTRDATNLEAVTSVAAVTSCWLSRIVRLSRALRDIGLWQSVKLTAGEPSKLAAPRGTEKENRKTG